MKKLVCLLLAATLALAAFSAVAETVKGPLVLYSSMTDNDIDNLIEAFNEKYPDVEVEVVNGSAGELEARARAEKDNPQGDLQWGGLSPSDGSANDDIFALYTSPYVPQVAAGALTVAFGDFSHYWIADRAGRTLQRLNELYATNGQIGYVATERVDGKVILPEAIQLLQMPAASK